MSGSPIASPFSSPISANGDHVFLMDTTDLPSILSEPLSFEGITPEPAAEIVPVEADVVELAVSLATNLVEEHRAEKEELLNRSLDFIEESLVAAKRVEVETISEMTTQMNELKVAYAKSQLMVVQLQGEKQATEEKYVALLTSFQQQAKSVAMCSELEETLALAQNRMSEYASENAQLRAKLSDLLDNPNSTYAQEKEQANLLIVQLREELKEIESQRDQALEEAKISAEAELESEAQIMELAKQAEDALSKVSLLQQDLAEAHEKYKELKDEFKQQQELLLAGGSSNSKIEKEELEQRLKQTEEKLKQTTMQRMEEYNSFEKKRNELKQQQQSEVQSLWDELKESQTKLVEAESMIEKMTFEMSLGIGSGVDVSAVGSDASMITQTPAPSKTVSRMAGLTKAGSKLPMPTTTPGPNSSSSVSTAGMNEEAKKRLSSLQAELVASKNQTTAHVLRIKALERELVNFKQQVSEAGSTSSALADSKSEVMRLNLELSQLKEKLVAGRKESSLAAAKLDAFQKMSKMETKACEKIKADAKAVATKMREASQKHAQVLQEKSTLERELGMAKKKLATADGIGEKLKASEKTVKDLSLEKTMLEKKLESANETSKKLHTEKTEVTAALVAKEAELVATATKHKDALTVLKGESDKLLAARNELQLKSDNAAKKIVELETELNNEKSVKAELTVNLKSTEKAKSELTVALANLEKKYTEAKEVVANLKTQHAATAEQLAVSQSNHRALVEKSKQQQADMKVEYLKIVGKLDTASKKLAETESALKTEKKSRASEVKSCKDEILSLTSDRDDLRLELSDSQNEVTQLNDKIKELEDEFTDEKSTHITKIKSLESDLKEMKQARQAEVKSMKEELVALNQKSQNEIKQLNQELESAIEAHQEEAKSLGTQIMELTSTRDELRLELSDAQNVAINLSDKLKELDHEFAEAKITHAAEITSLESTLASTRVSLSTAEAKIVSLESIQNELMTTLQQLQDTYESSTKEANEKESQLKDQLAQTQQSAFEKETDLTSQLATANSQLESAAHHQSETDAALESEKSAHASEVKSCQEEIARLSSVGDNLRLELSSSQQECALLSEKLKELESEFSEAKSNHASATSFMDGTLSATQLELSNAQAKIVSLESIQADMMTTLQQLQETFETSTKEANEKETQLKDQLAQTQQSAFEKETDLSSQLESANQLQAETAQALETEKSVHASEVKSCQDEIVGLTSIGDSLRVQLSSSQNDCTQLTEKLQALETEFASTKETNANTIASLESTLALTRTALSTAEAKIVSLESIQNELMTTLKSLQEEFELANKEANEKETQLKADLEQQQLQAQQQEQEFNEKLTAITTEKEKLTTELSSASEWIDTLDHDLKESQEELKTVNDELSQLKTELDSAKTDLEVVREEAERWEEKYDVVKAEKEKVEEELINAKENVHKFQHQTSRRTSLLENDLHAKDERARKHLKSINDITEQRDDLQKELEKTQARCQALELKLQEQPQLANMRQTRSTAATTATIAATGSVATASADELNKFKLRSEKLTANLLASKQVEKELKGEITKLKLELDLARSHDHSSVAVTPLAIQPLCVRSLQPTAAVSTPVAAPLKRKSLAAMNGKSVMINEANKENIHH